MDIVFRLFLTIVLFTISGFLTVYTNALTTIKLAGAAGQQFQNSDAAAIESAMSMKFFMGIGGLITLVTIVLLIVIWFFYIRKAVINLVMGFVLVPLFFAHPALAYFSTTEKTEAITIMPNESAFWIPDTAANKDTQTSLDSEAYFTANKIAVKRFVIPHQKLGNSGGWASFDSYVPTGRMIIVDRAIYVREWTKAAERGTTAKDESFPCQTNDGLNITAEVTIAASVTEENSPKFLHFFGVNNPPGDRSDPNVIFTSVYYGRSLTQVMDGIGRGFVQAIVCHEIGAVDFDTANKNYNAIMDSVKIAATKSLGDRGITVDNIGWAGTWTFDPDVQRAVNDRYTGVKVQPVLAALQQKAIIDSMEGWDHHLPTTLSLSIWPSGLIDAIAGMFHTSPGASGGGAR
jgi:hypothetical protein